MIWAWPGLGTSLKFLPENWYPCQNANQNAKNLGSVAPVCSKIAPIMLEIRFYIVQANNPVLANPTLFGRFDITLIQI